MLECGLYDADKKAGKQKVWNAEKARETGKGMRKKEGRRQPEREWGSRKGARSQKGYEKYVGKIRK